MRVWLILLVVALLPACETPATRPLLEAMSAPGGAYRPSGPVASLANQGRHAGTIMPFRQSNGPGRATVSLMETPLEPAAREVAGAGFTEVFGRVMDGVRLAAERSGASISLRAAGTVSANGEPLLRCGQVVHADDDGPPLGLWCAGVVGERLAVIHVRTLDEPRELAAAAEFASVALIALRRGAERGAPPIEAPPEYRRRGRDVMA
jgi:hypothetical protein